VLAGNTADCTTLKHFLTEIEAARGVWVMDRGIPTEALLAEMRDPARGVFYLVGTPKSPLCGEDLFLTLTESKGLTGLQRHQLRKSG